MSARVQSFRSVERRESEMSEEPSTLAKTIVMAAIEKGVSTHHGQNVLRGIDRLLTIVEQTARWSLPPGENNLPKSAYLHRPLPWIFFLPALLTLRMTRASLAYLLIICGLQPIQTQDIIRFIQSYRRTLRHLKYQGLRNMREMEQSRKPSRLFALFEPFLSRLSCFGASVDENCDDTECVVVHHSSDESKSTAVTSNYESDEIEADGEDLSNESENNAYKDLLLDKDVQVEMEMDDDNDKDYVEEKNTTLKSSTDSGTEVSEIDMSLESPTISNESTKHEGIDDDKIANWNLLTNQPTILITASDFDDHENLELSTKSNGETGSTEVPVSETVLSKSLSNDSGIQNKSPNTKPEKNPKGRNSHKRHKKSPHKYHH